MDGWPPWWSWCWPCTVRPGNSTASLAVPEMGKDISAMYLLQLRRMWSWSSDPCQWTKMQARVPLFRRKRLPRCVGAPANPQCHHWWRTTGYKPGQSVFKAPGGSSQKQWLTCIFVKRRRLCWKLRSRCLIKFDEVSLYKSWKVGA